MKIAFDLRYASDHFPGIGTHAIALLESMLALPENDAFEVLWDPSAPTGRHDLGGIRRHAKVTWNELPASALGVSGAWRVGAWLRGRRPDVYLSPYLIAPWRPGCPVVLTIHDVVAFDRPRDFPWPRRASLRLLLRLFASSAHWVTSSEFSRERIRRHTSIPATRLHVVRPGVPPGIAAAEERRPERAPEGPFALVVGINKPHKNLETVVRAWARFGDPPLDLVSAGPRDSRYADAAALARSVGARRVTALGSVGESELRWLYRHATMFLLPSVYEGFGFPLLEAMASGTPAIASDIPVLRELGGDAPLWVSPVEPDAWLRAVNALWNDPDERKARTEAARERASCFGYPAAARDVRGVLMLARAQP